MAYREMVRATPSCMVPGTPCLGELPIMFKEKRSGVDAGRPD